MTRSRNSHDRKCICLQRDAVFYADRTPLISSGCSLDGLQRWVTPGKRAVVSPQSRVMGACSQSEGGYVLCFIIERVDKASSAAGAAEQREGRDL